MLYIQESNKLNKIRYKLQTPRETGSDIKVQEKTEKMQQNQERADLWEEQSPLFFKPKLNWTPQNFKK